MPTCAVCRARDAVVFCEADGASRRARRRSCARGREITCRHLLRARADSDGSTNGRERWFRVARASERADGVTDDEGDGDCFYATRAEVFLCDGCDAVVHGANEVRPGRRRRRAGTRLDSIRFDSIGGERRGAARVSE